MIIHCRSHFPISSHCVLWTQNLESTSQIYHNENKTTNTITIKTLKLNIEPLQFIVCLKQVVLAFALSWNNIGALDKQKIGTVGYCAVHIAVYLRWPYQRYMLPLTYRAHTGNFAHFQYDPVIPYYSNIVIECMKENKENPNRSALNPLSPFAAIHWGLRVSSWIAQFGTVVLIGNEHSPLKMISGRTVHNSSHCLLNLHSILDILFNGVLNERWE